MRDLLTVHRLDELRKAGVTALKIEGRLKTAAWVRQAVSLYKRALAGEDAGELAKAAEALGDYTGRASTCGYLDAQRDALTGLAAGRGGEGGGIGDWGLGIGAPDSGDSGCPSPSNPQSLIPNPSPSATYDLEINVEPKGIVCRCTCAGHRVEWTLPKTVVRRQYKAVPIAELFDRLDGETVQKHTLGHRATSDPEFLLVPRAANAVIDRIAGVIRQARKKPDELVRIELPAAVEELLEKDQPSEANRLALGEGPDRVRLEPRMVASLLRNVRPSGIIVEGLATPALRKALAAAEGVPLVVALPQVFFEGDLARGPLAPAGVQGGPARGRGQQLGRLALGAASRRAHGERSRPAGAQLTGGAGAQGAGRPLRHGVDGGGSPAVGGTHCPLAGPVLDRGPWPAAAGDDARPAAGRPDRQGL